MVKHISEVIREFVANNPQLSKRLKLCEACHKYYDVKTGHECQLSGDVRPAIQAKREGR